MKKTLRDRLCSSAATLRRFATDRSGNFAMITAIAMLPVLGAAGLAVDYANLSRTRSALQQALDSAVLAVAREGTLISNHEARRIAERHIAGNFELSFSELEVLRDGTSVLLKAKVDKPLFFASFLGHDKATLNGAASADIAILSYEIALVLDTTGSMRGGKLQSMKDAVVGLINDISDQVKDKEKLKFSLVPFATFVNVGPHHGPEFDDKGKIRKGTGAEWLDLKGKSDVPQLELQPGLSRFEVYHRLGQEWKGCVETRMASNKGDHDVDDTAAVKSDMASYFVPAFAIDEPDHRAYRNSYIHSNVDPFDNTPNGKLKKLLKYGVLDLIDDVGGSLGVNLGLGGNAAPRTDYSDGKGPGRGCDTQPITPLSNDYKDLIRKVNTLQARGNTNIMEGVAWGMRVLSPHEPFTGGDERPGLQKIMIVLTDGANVFGNNWTQLGSTYSSFGYMVDGRLDGMTVASRDKTNQVMNEKTLAACTNAKKKYDISIYTIRLEEPDVETGSMLRECASGNAQYFDTPSRSQLKDVFREIGEKIVRLRLSS